MANIAAIKQDIAKMIDAGAPESDVDAYVAAHGLTAKDFQPSITEKAINTAEGFGEGAQMGFSRLGVGLIQTGAEKLGADNLVELTKKTATRLENQSNRNKEQSPVAGTLGEIAPQILAVSGLGTSLPAIAAGGGALSYFSPEVNKDQIEPYAGTAFERVLRPVAGATSKLVEYAGVNPDSRAGRGIEGTILGGMAYGAGKGVGAAAKGVNKGVRAAVRGLTKIDQDAVAALQKSGIDPTLQLTSDSFATRSLSNSLQKLPLVGNKLTKSADDAITKLEGNVEGAAKNLGDATDPVSGGAALQRGLDKFKQQTGDMAARNYQAVDNLIPPQTPAQMTNTRQFAKEYAGKYSDTPNIAKAIKDSNVTNLSRAVLEDQNVPYQTLKNLRTDIGEQAGKLDAPAAYKQMYGAASDDMFNTARAVSPEAEQAAIRANNYYRAVTQRSDKLKRFFTQHQDGTFRMSPEQAANATRTELQLLKKSIPKAEFDDYSASVLRRMGDAPAGAQNATGDVFSPNAFLTNYNKLMKSGKADVLFNSELTKELNRTAKVADRFKQLSRANNNSNTTNAALATGSLAGFYFAPTTTATLGAGAYGMSRLLTSPKALKVINNYAYRPVVGGGKVSAEFSQRLLQATEADPYLHREARQYLDIINDPRVKLYNAQGEELK